MSLIVIMICEEDNMRFAFLFFKNLLIALSGIIFATIVFMLLVYLSYTISPVIGIGIIIMMPILLWAWVDTLDDMDIDKDKQQ